MGGSSSKKAKTEMTQKSRITEQDKAVLVNLNYFWQSEMNQTNF